MYQRISIPNSATTRSHHFSFCSHGVESKTVERGNAEPRIESLLHTTKQATRATGKKGRRSEQRNRAFRLSGYPALRVYVNAI
jgi:hypothetical protein